MFHTHLFCSAQVVGFFRTLIFVGLAMPHIASANQTTLSVIESSKNGPRFSVMFEGSPRVSQVIEQGSSLIHAERATLLAHSSSSIYWPGVGLFKDAPNSETQTLLLKVENKLEQLEEAWRNEDKAKSTAVSLNAFLQSSDFMTRIPVELDLDYYLAGGKVNPLLQGALTLQLPKRPDHVWVVGAVNSSKQVDFSARKTASDYLDDVEALNTFGTSRIVIIQPNGKLEEHAVAYWNEHPQNIAPGAVIFVPFQRLPSHLSSLNSDISSLLQHRVL